MNTLAETNAQIKTPKKNWIEKFIYLILASPALFLLINKYPYFLVLSIIVVVFMGLLFFLNLRQITSYHYPILLLLVLIYMYFIISYFFSGQYLSNFLSYTFLRTDGNFFFCYILFFAFSVPFFNYRKVINYFFKLIFFIFSIFSLIGLIEFIIGKQLLMTKLESEVGILYFALNTAHNATGSVYGLVSIFALVFFLEERIKKIKIIYSIVFMLSIIGLFLSKSRGSYVAFIIAALFVFWIYFNSIKKFLISLSSLIIVSFTVLWATSSLERFFQIFSTEGTAAIRLELWDKAWSLFTKSPLAGVGFGRYNDIISIFHQDLAGYDGLLTVFLNPVFYFGSDHAHNSYLHLLSETGVIGLGLLILFWCLCFQIIFKALKLTEDVQLIKVFLSGLGCIILLFVLSLTENYFSATTVMIPSSMIVSLCIGLAWQERNRNTSL